ncbi:MAG: hypothetical protein U0Y82_03140 [Thermoleophilia bacterium]
MRRVLLVPLVLLGVLLGAGPATAAVQVRWVQKPAGNVLTPGAAYHFTARVTVTDGTRDLAVFAGGPLATVDPAAPGCVNNTQVLDPEYEALVGGEVNCTIAFTAPGTRDLAFTFRAPAYFRASAEVYLGAFDTTDGGFGGASAPALVYTVQAGGPSAPELTTPGVFPDRVGLGERRVVTLVAVNHGAGPARDLTVAIAPPESPGLNADLSEQPAAADVTFDGPGVCAGRHRCNLGTVPAGGSVGVPVRIDGRVYGGGGGTIAIISVDDPSGNDVIQHATLMNYVLQVTDGTEITPELAWDAPSVATFDQGAAVGFTGTLINRGDTPIAGAEVWVAAHPQILGDNEARFAMHRIALRSVRIDGTDCSAPSELTPDPVWFTFDYGFWHCPVAHLAPGASARIQATGTAPSAEGCPSADYRLGTTGLIAALHAPSFVTTDRFGRVEAVAMLQPADRSCPTHQGGTPPTTGGPSTAARASVLRLARAIPRGAVLRNAVATAVLCGGPCRVTATVTIGRRAAAKLGLAGRSGGATIGRGTTTLATAGTARMRLVLTTRARRALARHPGRVVATVTYRFVAPGVRTATVRRTTRLG